MVTDMKSCKCDVGVGNGLSIRLKERSSHHGRRRTGTKEENTKA